MRLPGPLSGLNPLVGWLNALREACAANIVTSVVGGRLERGAWGTVIHVAPQGPAGSNVSRYHVKTHAANHLVCRSWDGTTEGTVDIYIAKPPELRYSVLKETVDGTLITYSDHDESMQTRLATEGAATETQVIVPRYRTEKAETGDEVTEIMAINVLGGTGVSFTLTAPDPDEVIAITLIDLNVAGRAWAKQAAA